MVHSHSHCEAPINPGDKAYQKVLWIALFINFAMFFIEVIYSYVSHSVSLLADSIDFIGDAFNYGISLYVLNKHLKLRAKASILKAAFMFVFAIVVIASVSYNLFIGVVPVAEKMGAVGILALFANMTAAVLLFRHKEGDSNRLSVWLCTRNDAIGNVAVVIAAFLVYVTNTNIPDLAVAVIMGFMGLFASIRIFKKAWRELKS